MQRSPRWRGWASRSPSSCWPAIANALILLAALVPLPLVRHVGQDWFAYGWDIQLFETGFLAVFLVPLLDGRPFPRRQPPVLVIWLFRWLVLRIMLGAGLIKLRGDPCWPELSCLDHHYETQPMPNPLSRAFHLAPAGCTRPACSSTTSAELVAPLFAFGPRRVRHVAGCVMVGFQLMLIAERQPVVPQLAHHRRRSLACFDDRFLARVLPRRLRERAEAAAAAARPSSWQTGCVRRCSCSSRAQRRASAQPAVAAAEDEHAFDRCSWSTPTARSAR